MNLSDKLGIAYGCCMVVFMWWLVLSVWFSKMIEINSKCDSIEIPVILSVLKTDMFCGDSND